MLMGYNSLTGNQPGDLVTIYNFFLFFFLLLLLFFFVLFLFLFLFFFPYRKPSQWILANNNTFLRILLVLHKPGSHFGVRSFMIKNFKRGLKWKLKDNFY